MKVLGYYVGHTTIFHRPLPSAVLLRKLTIACRAELGRYPLSIDIKASIFSYWLRLQHKTANRNLLFKEAFHHARNHSQFFDVLNNDETIRMHSTSNIASQQHIKNARSSIKIQLKKDYIRNWLKAIPAEGRTCLVCNRGYIEDERHFLMYCPGYDSIRNELYSLVSKHDAFFQKPK